MTGHQNSCRMMPNYIQNISKSDRVINLNNFRKGMFSHGWVNKNCAYFKNSGSNWTKLGIFVNKHHILHAIDLNFG